MRDSAADGRSGVGVLLRIVRRIRSGCWWGRVSGGSGTFGGKWRRRGGAGAVGASGSALRSIQPAGKARRYVPVSSASDFVPFALRQFVLDLGGGGNADGFCAIGAAGEIRRHPHRRPKPALAPRTTHLDRFRSITHSRISQFAMARWPTFPFVILFFPKCISQEARRESRIVYNRDVLRPHSDCLYHNERMDAQSVFAAVCSVSSGNERCFPLAGVYMPAGYAIVVLVVSLATCAVIARAADRDAPP